MSSEQLAQEVVELRTQNLTPVSPKPLHFPKPSNIPLLDNQMDPAFENPPTLALDETHAQGNQNGQTSDMNGQEIPGNSLQSLKDNDIARNENAAGQGLDNDVAMSVDSGVEAQPVTQAISSTSSSLPQSTSKSDVSTQSANDAAMAFLQSLSLPFPKSTTPGGNELFGRPASSNDQSMSTEQGISTSNDVVMGGQPMGGVDFEALLAKLSTPVPASDAGNAPAAGPPSNASESVTQTSGPPGIHQTPIHLIPTAPSLPARPPVQQQGGERIHHPYDHQSPTGKFASTNQAPSNATPLSSAAGANGEAPSTFQQRANSVTPSLNQAPEGGDAAIREDEDEPFSSELQAQYESFMNDERNFMQQGEWDKFPMGSRMFIGNLISEKVSKQDIFRVFHKYGKLAQISIKQAYGFVQFLDAESCLRALEAEQGASIRGRKIHLEISKPQKSKNQNNDRRGGQRRSRSPDYRRNSGNDRYRNNDSRQNRGRDAYRPGGRSPSPRRGYRRSPDRYDGRRRSPSPRSRGGRFRSPDRGLPDDDCPLPRRRSEDIPDIQIISREPPERSFMQYVERAFQARNIKCDVLILSPRLDEASVLRRQIIEGVHAVMKLERTVQYTNKFPLSVFDRSTPGNVRFEEYQDLDLNICVELVLRAKQSAVRAPIPPPMPSYGYGGQGQSNIAPPPPPAYPPQFPTSTPGAPPFPPVLPPNLDQATLQRLLAQGQPNMPPAQYNPQTPSAPHLPDLSRLLASANAASAQQVQPQQPYGAQQPSASNASYQDLLSNAAIAALLQQQPQQTPQPGQVQQYGQQPSQAPQQGGQPDMQNIMAQLARYNK